MVQTHYQVSTTADYFCETESPSVTADVDMMMDVLLIQLSIVVLMVLMLKEIKNKKWLFNWLTMICTLCRGDVHGESGAVR